MSFLFRCSLLIYQRLPSRNWACRNRYYVKCCRSGAIYTFQPLRTTNVRRRLSQWRRRSGHAGQVPPDRVKFASYQDLWCCKLWLQLFLWPRTIQGHFTHYGQGQNFLVMNGCELFALGTILRSYLEKYCCESEQMDRDLHISWNLLWQKVVLLTKEGQPFF